MKSLSNKCRGFGADASVAGFDHGDADGGLQINAYKGNVKDSEKFGL